MRQLPASSECSHEKHDGPKVLRLDHLHRVITTNGDSRSLDHLVGGGEQGLRPDARMCGGEVAPFTSFDHLVAATEQCDRESDA
jgi:hypothetical protein